MHPKRETQDGPGSVSALVQHKQEAICHLDTESTLARLGSLSLLPSWVTHDQKGEGLGKVPVNPMETLDAKVGCCGAADWGSFSPLSLRTWLLVGQDEDRPEGDSEYP